MKNIDRSQAGSYGRKLVIPLPNIAERRSTLDAFSQMLRQATTENDWQKFFDENPFVLTETLPLKFDAIYSQVPLKSGRPDYVFYRSSTNGLTGDFGVIELKLPTHPIIGSYSSKIITPSRHLGRAEQQARNYLESISLGGFARPDNFFVAGNRQHAFIVIGSSTEVARKCHSQVLLNQFRNFLPRGFHVYTYDEIFELFGASVGPLIKVLIVTPRLTGRFKINWKFGLHQRPAVRLVHTAAQFQSKIVIHSEDRPEDATDAKSILGVLLLAMLQGETICAEIEGFDAHDALSSLSDLVASDFGMEAKRERDDGAVAPAVIELIYFLDINFPNRAQRGIEEVAGFLDEMRVAGASLNDIAMAIARFGSRLPEMEREAFPFTRGGPLFWSQTGVARHLLDLTNDAFWRRREESVPADVKKLTNRFREKFK